MTDEEKRKRRRDLMMYGIALSRAGRVNHGGGGAPALPDDFPTNGLTYKGHALTLGGEATTVGAP